MSPTGGRGRLIDARHGDETMALEMRSACEGCQTPLGSEDLAFICSFECTFCPACTVKSGQHCPNCSGELVRRPRRGAD